MKLSPWFTVLAVVVAAGAGYWAGRSTRAASGRAERAETSPSLPPERRQTIVPAGRLAELERSAARAVELEEELARLRRERREAPGRLRADDDLPAGARRPDRSIVGGARWSESFVRMGTGFFDALMEEFLEEADVTPEQERRLRDQMRDRIERALELTADFTNGDVDGDMTYERLDALAKETDVSMESLLDTGQLPVYRAFRRRLDDMFVNQVIQNEVGTLSADLDLDPSQEKKVRAVVEERYRTIRSRVNQPLPNVMFKIIRREQDRQVYEETAQQIRSHLRPEQFAAFDRFERDAPKAPYAYRTMLVPK